MTTEDGMNMMTGMKMTTKKKKKKMIKLMIKKKSILQGITKAAKITTDIIIITHMAIPKSIERKKEE